MRAILPSDHESVSSFTQIGHIAHLNLKDEVLPYKHLIGEFAVYFVFDSHEHVMKDTLKRLQEPMFHFFTL